MYNVQKLPFPRHLATTPYSADLWTGNLIEDGAPEVGAEVTGKKCIFSERAKRITTQDGKHITLNAIMLCEGDIAPQLPTVCGGEVTVGNKKMQIHAGYRPRNPDGSVHHTKLELI